MDMGLFSKKDEITKAVRRAKGKKDYNPRSEAKKVTKPPLDLNSQTRIVRTVLLPEEPDSPCSG
jgi:hypothetical protein